MVAGNTLRPKLCNFDLVNGQFDSWNPIPDAAPVAMQANQNSLFIGGSFQNSGWHYHPNLAAININWATGIPITNFEQKIEMKIFPNPTSDVVTVFMKSNFGSEITLQVFDVNGNVVKEGNVVNRNSLFSLNLSALLPGLYVIKVVDEVGNSCSGRIIKN